jgi:hypothetical protein
MDSFRFMITNPDSKKVRFVPYETNPGFVAYRGSRILTLKDIQLEKVAVDQHVVINDVL